MKETYEKLEVEIITFEDEDFHVASDPGGGPYACC